MLRHLSLHFRYRIYFCVFEPPLDPDRRIFHADRGYETLTLIRKTSDVFLRKLIFNQRKCISLLQMKYILFLSVGENTACTDDIKGIVSRDFEGLQIILMNRTCVPDVPLKVYSF